MLLDVGTERRCWAETLAVLTVGLSNVTLQPAGGVSTLGMVAVSLELAGIWKSCVNACAT